MLRHWDEFPLAPDTKQATWTRVSLTPRGIISINRAAHKAMGQPHWVALFFDKLNSLIGLRGCPAGVKNAFPLIRQAKSGSYIIRGKKFCNYYRIRLDAAVVFNDIETEPDGMIVLDLKTTTEYVRRSKPNSSKRIDSSIIGSTAGRFNHPAIAVNEYAQPSASEFSD